MVVRELWSTKYRTPSAVYFISQPGGRGCSLIILQQGEGGSEHGPSRRREPCAGGTSGTHLPEKIDLLDLEDMETFWGFLGAMGKGKEKERKPHGGHRLPSRRCREHLEGKLMLRCYLFTL